jgi:multidrug efflux system outer membrane protein
LVAHRLAENPRRNAQPETRSGEVQTMRMKFKLFLVLVTIQIGCTGMPLFAHPSLPAKASRNAPTEIHGLRHGVPQLLRQFEDPLLDRFMAEAISSTKDPAILAFRIREARAMHRGYELSPFPSTTNATRIAELQLITARQEGAGSNPLEGDLFDPGFDSLWEINFFCAHRNSTEVADAVYGTRAYDLRAIQVSVEGEIARNYFEFQASLGRWNVAERHAQTLARILKIAEGRRSAGKDTVFETEHSRVLLAYTRTASLRINAERAVALDCLAVLLGRSPSALAEELSHSGQLSVLPKQIDVGSPEQLLRRRSDIAAAERRLAGPAAKAGISVEDLFPRVVLSGNTNPGAMPLDEVQWQRGFRNSIVPMISWPQFRLNRVNAQILSSNSPDQQVLASYSQTVLQAVAETEIALTSFDQARSQCARLAQAAQASRNAANSATIRFNRGIGTFSEALDAERAQFEAEDLLVESRAKTATAMVALFKALGAGFDGLQ